MLFGIAGDGISSEAMSGDDERGDEPRLGLCPGNDVYEIFVVSLHGCVLVSAFAFSDGVGGVEIEDGIVIGEEGFGEGDHLVLGAKAAESVEEEGEAAWRCGWGVEVSDHV